MAASLPNGAIFSAAKSYDPAVTITDISNANPAVATAAGHTFVVGDIVSIVSGWSSINERAFRVTAVDSDTFTIGNIDTTNTDRYPADSGGGSAKRVAGWQQIQQVMNPSMSGGEQQFLEYQFLEEDDQRQLPTTRSAQSITIPIADDESLPHWPVLEAADQGRELQVVKLTLRNGSEVYYNCYISVTDTPSLETNNIMTRTVTLALSGRPARYAKK